MKNRTFSKKLMVLLIVAVIAIPAMFAASFAYAEDPIYARINTETDSGAHFRQTPGGEVIGTAKKGVILQVLGEERAVNGGVWVHMRGVLAPNTTTVREGYVYKDYVKYLTPEENAAYIAGHKIPDDPKPTPASGKWGITTAGVNVRASGSTSAARVTGLNSGTVVEIVTAPKTTTASDWYYVRANGYIGYVNAPYIRVLSDEEAEKRGLITPKPEDTTPVPAETTPVPGETTPVPGDITPQPVTPVGYVKIIKTSVYFRQSPEGTILGSVYMNEVLPYLYETSEKINGYKWVCLYNKNNVQGFVRSDMLIFTDASGKPVKTNTPTVNPDPTTPSPINPDDYDKYAVVKSGGLNFRTGPSTSSSSMGFLNKGDILPMFNYDSTGKWCYVYSSRYNAFGYVSKDYVTIHSGSVKTPTPAPTVTPAPTDPGTVVGYVAVKNSGINVRKSNSISSDVVTSAKANSVLEMLGSVPDAKYDYTWYHVRTSDGKTGYVRSDVAYQMSDWQVEEWKKTGKLATPTPRTEPTATPNPSGLSNYIQITATSAIARSSASTSSAKAGNVSRGAVYKILGTTKAGNYTWYKIQYSSSKTAYVRSDLLKVMTNAEYQAYEEAHKTPTPRPTATPHGPQTEDLSDLGITLMSNANIREETSTKSLSVGKTGDKGSHVVYLGNYVADGDMYWYNIQYGSDTGWMRSDVVRIFTQREKLAYQQSGNPDNWPEASYTTLSVGSTGSAVTALQKELAKQGYFNEADIGNTYGSKTEAAVKKFQEDHDLTVDGIAGADTQHALFKTVPEGTYSGDDPDLKPVEMVDWFKGDIQDFWGKGEIAIVTDVKTGKSFRARRWSGGNHADVEPLTAADTKVMCAIYGVTRAQDIADQDLYQRHPLWVTITKNGVTRTFAASMYGEPHNYPAGDTIPDNDFNGQFCIHFVNSMTHGDEKNPAHVDKDHQNAIKAAYDAYWNKK